MPFGIIADLVFGFFGIPKEEAILGFEPDGV
jgi:hypothetical protein